MSVLFHSSIMGPGSLIICIKKKVSGIFFLLFISTLSHILVPTNCPRADKSLFPSPSTRIVSDSLAAHPSYSVICLFVFPFATFAPSKELACPGKLQ